MNKVRLLLIFALVLLVVVYFALDLGRFLQLEFVQSKIASWRDVRYNNFILCAALYVAVYVVLTGISVPGSTLLTLTGGAIFGFGWGLLLASVSSAIGATLAFLSSRLLLKSCVQKHFQSVLKTVCEGVERDGAFYLFSLRMIPLFPFSLINLAMGLTPMRTWTFFWVTLLGMSMSTVIYVYAGVELGRVESLSGLLDTSLIVALLLLALMPWIAKFLMNAVLPLYNK